MEGTICPGGVVEVDALSIHCVQRALNASGQKTVYIHRWDSKVRGKTKKQVIQHDRGACLRATDVYISSTHQSV